MKKIKLKNHRQKNRLALCSRRRFIFIILFAFAHSLHLHSQVTKPNPNLLSSFRPSGINGDIKVAFNDDGIGIICGHKIIKEIPGGGPWGTSIDVVYEFVAYRSTDGINWTKIINPLLQKSLLDTTWTLGGPNLRAYSMGKKLILTIKPFESYVSEDGLNWSRYYYKGRDIEQFISTNGGNMWTSISHLNSFNPYLSYNEYGKIRSLFKEINGSWVKLEKSAGIEWGSPGIPDITIFYGRKTLLHGYDNFYFLNRKFVYYTEESYEGTAKVVQSDEMLLNSLVIGYYDNSAGSNKDAAKIYSWAKLGDYIRPTEIYGSSKDSKILYALFEGRSGIYVSLDAGLTFQPLKDKTPFRDADRIFPSCTEGEVFVAGVDKSNGNYGKIYRIKNAGTLYTEIFDTQSGHLKSDSYSWFSDFMPDGKIIFHNNQNFYVLRDGCSNAQLNDCLVTTFDVGQATSTKNIDGIKIYGSEQFISIIEKALNNIKIIRPDLYEYYIKNGGKCDNQSALKGIKPECKRGINTFDNDLNVLIYISSNEIYQHYNNYPEILGGIILHEARHACQANLYYTKYGLDYEKFLAYYNKDLKTSQIFERDALFVGVQFLDSAIKKYKIDSKEYKALYDALKRLNELYYSDYPDVNKDGVFNRDDIKDMSDGVLFDLGNTSSQQMLIVTDALEGNEHSSASLNQIQVSPAPKNKQLDLISSNISNNLNSSFDNQGAWTTANGDVLTGDGVALLKVSQKGIPMKFSSGDFRVDANARDLKIRIAKNKIGKGEIQISFKELDSGAIHELHSESVNNSAAKTTNILINTSKALDGDLDFTKIQPEYIEMKIDVSKISGKAGRLEISFINKGSLKHGIYIDEISIE
jgi:hypothetical protein